LIRNPQRNAVVITEIKFHQIPMKVLLAAVLINALHAALKDAEKALNRVGVDRAILKGITVT
jgi:hypothetical protein